MKQVRTKMTDLDRGLVISGRLNGLSIEELCEVFHRDYSTISRIVRKQRGKLPSLKTIRARRRQAC